MAHFLLSLPKENQFPRPNMGGLGDLKDAFRHIQKGEQPSGLSYYWWRWFLGLWPQERTEMLVWAGMSPRVFLSKYTILNQCKVGWRSFATYEEAKAD
jgi:hypothetical protein